MTYSNQKMMEMSQAETGPITYTIDGNFKWTKLQTEVYDGFSVIPFPNKVERKAVIEQADSEQNT